MKAPSVSLAELHRRFDGPIEDGMRQAVLTGRRRSASWILSLASRDLDRLALSTVVARARQRGARRQTADRLVRNPTEAALEDALLWYRALGVRTIEARDALDHAPRRSDA